MAWTAQSWALLIHSRLLKANFPIVLTPSQQYLLLFWWEKKKNRMHLLHGIRKKKKKARFSFHISDCLQTCICETFHSKINCVLKKVWNSRAFMLPSFEMASECRSLLSFLKYFLTINRINDHRARSLPNPSGPKCEKRRRREGTF